MQVSIVLKEQQDLIQLMESQVKSAPPVVSAYKEQPLSLADLRASITLQKEPKIAVSVLIAYQENIVQDQLIQHQLEIVMLAIIDLRALHLQPKM